MDAVGLLSEEDKRRVWDAIADTQPGSYDDLRKMLFKLARKLKAIEVLANRQSDDLIRIVKAWRKKASERVDGLSWEEVWFVFGPIWTKTKFPDNGANIALQAIPAAKNRPLPECAARYADNGKMELLIKLCLELQERNGWGRSFILTCRDAGKALSCGYKQANNLTRILQKDGVLVVTKKPPRNSGLGYSYKFVGEV